MAETPEEGVKEEQRPKESWLHRLVSRVDLPFLAVAALLGLVAATSDPWWTVQSPESDTIIHASVSPFFVRIVGLGIPSTIPNSDIMGIVARVVLGLTAAALAWQSFFPLSVWKKPVLWLSLSAIAGVFLNFALFVHSTQLVLLQQYGVVPQLTGDNVIPGVVLSTDLVSYFSPTISSSLGLAFYAALGGFILLGASELTRYILSPHLGLDLSGLVTGLTGAFLSPPYQHAWLTSNDQGLNPLGKNPDRMTDEELAQSFEKLRDALQPGSLVSVILPPWATGLNDRLVRVVPWTGFDLENSQVIFRSPGRPENELVFRKPTPPEEVQPDLAEQVEAEEIEAESERPVAGPHRELDEEGDLGGSPINEAGMSNDLYQPGRPHDIEGPPADEQIEDPVWAQAELGPQERAIVESAVRLIQNEGEPIPYRDLIHHVYLEMVQHHVGFESGNQIEVVLLQHVGKELSIFEHLDETGANVVRAWGLGETIGQAEEGSSNNVKTKFSGLGKKMRGMKGLLGTWKPLRHKEEVESEEDVEGSQGLEEAESEDDTEGFQGSEEAEPDEDAEGFQSSEEGRAWDEGVQGSEE